MLHFRQTRRRITPQQTPPQHGAMQRATAITGRWVGALAAMPALLFCFPASAASTRDHASASSYPLAPSSESVLTRWHEYALASITPQFTWAALPATNAAPRVLDQYGARLDMPPLFSSATKNTHVAVSIASGIVGDAPGTLQNSTPSRLGVPQSGVERTVITPSLVQQ